MRIEEINKEQLNQFLTQQKHSQFLQSFEWGELQEKEGRRVIRLGFFEQGNLFFALSLFLYQLPLGMKYLHAPRIGIKFLSEEQLKFIFSEIEKTAKKEKAIFLRFEPRSQLSITNYELPITKTIDWNPSKTLILDLTMPEEELLKNMHQKTRYNVRLAEKRGVAVREMKNEEDFVAWWKIMEETRERDGFRLHPRKHYENMLGFSGFDDEGTDSTGSFDSLSLAQDDKTLKFKLVVAEYQGEIIAGNIMSYFGDMATYVHGASSNQHRNVMSPYLLQWEAMKLAKKLGYKYYDMHGIEEKYPGVASFKRRFNGEEIDYPGTLDLVYNQLWYNVYRVIRKIRRYF